MYFMRKLVCVFILFSMVGIFINSPLAADTALKKLGRGISNVASSPLEVWKRISDVNNENGPIAAFTWGLLNGIFRTGIRAIVGIYEVVTFPIPLPKDYEPIITDPEFFFEEGLE